MTDLQWQVFVEAVYEEQERRDDSIEIDWTSPVSDDMTDDRLTFGAWRAALESYLFAYGDPALRRQEREAELLKDFSEQVRRDLDHLAKRTE